MQCELAALYKSKNISNCTITPNLPTSCSGHATVLSKHDLNYITPGSHGRTADNYCPEWFAPVIQNRTVTCTVADGQDRLIYLPSETDRCQLLGHSKPPIYHTQKVQTGPCCTQLQVEPDHCRFNRDDYRSG